MVLRKRHAAGTDHSFSGSPGWRSCFPILLPFLILEARFKEGRKWHGKGSESSRWCGALGGKPVASIRTWERLSALSKMLSRKYTEKVLWSVCKNSSPFPFSSHSSTVWKLTSEDTMVQRGQQKETQQSGSEALWEAEISFSLMSVGFPAHLHHREVGTQVWIPLQPPPFGDIYLHQGLLWESQGVKKASAAWFEFEKVWNRGSGTNKRGFSQYSIFQCT